MVSLCTGLIPQVALGLIFLFSPRFWGTKEILYTGENNLDLHLKAERKSCGLAQDWQSLLSLPALASGELSSLGSRGNKHPHSLWEVGFLLIPWTTEISASHLWILGVPVVILLSHALFQFQEFQPQQ